MSKSLLFILFLSITTNFVQLKSQPFVHPGMLHTESDLIRMQNKVSLSLQPWKGSWDRLVSNGHSSSGWGIQLGTDTVIYRGSDGVHAENYTRMYNDVAAAYANALRWKIAGTEDNAQKAVEILNRYARQLKAIRGSTDASLAIGIYGYQMCNAAEIMRSYPGWEAADFKAFQDFAIKVFYGTDPDYNGAHRFLVRHNGTCDTHYWVNWDLCNMACVMAVGILCDNRAIYNEAVNYFKTGVGNGNINRMVNFLYDGGLGQWQESGRDQGHSMLGQALAGPFCEMAWNQGDDLYGYDNNRLLKGFESVAKYNLGNKVPYTPYNNCDNVNQTIISSYARGADRPGWELIYNHYVVRKGLTSPYIQIYANKMRPEGGGGDYGSTSGGYDQLGYGTLTATIDTKINKQSQTITFPAKSVTFGDSDFDPGAISTSGLPCNYSISNTTNAEVINNKIHMISPGTVQVTAWQNGDEIYSEAAPVTQTITINNPTIVTIPEDTVKFYVKSTGMCVDVNSSSLLNGYAVLQTEANSGKSQMWIISKVTEGYYKILNLNSGLALHVSNNVNYSGAIIEQRTYDVANEQYYQWQLVDNGDGTFKIINKGNGLAMGVQSASTTSNANFEVNTYTGATHQKFIILLSNSIEPQSISFPKLPEMYPGDPDIILTATATSGLPVSYVSTNPSVATVSNGILHVLKGGTTQIIASQSGNIKYAPALEVTQTLVSKKKQTINIPDFPATITYKDKNFKLGATSSSGLELTVSSFKSSVARYATASDSIILGLPGSTIITVTQQGTSEYLPAYSQKSLVVNKLSQIINFPVVPLLKIGDADFSPAATASSGLTVTYKSSNAAVATIANNKIRVVGVGTTTVTASQAGSVYYNAAESSQIVTVESLNGLNSSFDDQFSIRYLGEDMLQVTFTNDFPAKSIMVYDLFGRLERAIYNCSANQNIDISNLPKGVYFIKLKYGNSISTRKMLRK